MKIQGKKLFKGAMLVGLFTGAWLGLAQTASAQLNIQIVNDSGLPDTNVYIMVPGASASESITPQSLFVDKDSGTGTSVPLSSLATNGTVAPFSLTSPISGNTNKVYTFQVGFIKSGAIYFIYNNPFTFANGTTPSPAPGAGNGVSGYRYDYAELSYLGGVGDNDVDLTYVDKFGIPLQLEWFRPSSRSGNLKLLDGSYVYASTKTLANLFASSGFTNAAFSLTSPGTPGGDITPGWQYIGPSSYSNFARIVSPEKANSTGASVSPYPDATNYLNFLITNPFVLNGYSVQGGSVKVGLVTTNYLYYYLGYQVSVATNVTGGWTFTMSYNPSLVPSNYNLTAIGAVASSTPTNVSIPLPYTNTISFSTPNMTTNSNSLCAGAFIYGSPVGTNYLVNGLQVTDVTHPSYPVEAWMMGDVLSSINFGFAGGVYGANSKKWYSPTVAWTSYPYGWAQPSPYNNPTNGFFDPYAGLMYYEADAYTFAFSERITPDVGMSVSPGDTVRITILPDDRLDSPVPEVQTVTSNSITLAWNAVAGASRYEINMLRPLGIPSVITNSTSYTFNNLIPGAPYVMSVQAMGTHNGNPLITPTRPITATTAGTYITATGSLVTVNVALAGVVDPFSRVQAAYINGIEVQPQAGQWVLPGGGGYPHWTASQGTNQFPIQLVDQNSNVVFDDWATFVLSPPATNREDTATNTTISDIKLYGQLAGTITTFAGGPGSSGNTMPITEMNDVISYNYTPTEIRKANPLNVIVSAPSSVLISGVASNPLTGITFNFTIPNGDNYIIESSTNLTSWQTNSTGTGTGNQQSYTNTDTSPAQFYRIKLP